MVSCIPLPETTDGLRDMYRPSRWGRGIIPLPMLSKSSGEGTSLAVGSPLRCGPETADAAATPAAHGQVIMTL